MRINVLDMSTSSPHWHTLFCDRIYESKSRCAQYRSWGTPVSSYRLADDVAAWLNLIAHILCMSALTAAVAEWLGRMTPWSCWRYGEREVVSSIPGRGNIVGWVFHPTRWLERFSLIWICLSFQILNLFRTLSSWGSINYKPSALLL